MKRQYFGDSKDSFKWDYHDHLVSELQYPRLSVALMLTPDDGGTHGSSQADLFPARSSIIRLCDRLRQNRNYKEILTLHDCGEARYEVTIRADLFTHLSRAEYFHGFDREVNQVVFLDPDNGFEPDKSCTEKHVRYADVQGILTQLSDESLVSVFHHFRRVSFTEDFDRIRSRLRGLSTTAIYWHSLMFVAASHSQRVIDSVISANEHYSRTRPVALIR